MRTYLSTCITKNSINYTKKLIVRISVRCRNVRFRRTSVGCSWMRWIIIHVPCIWKQCSDTVVSKATEMKMCLHLIVLRTCLCWMTCWKWINERLPSGCAFEITHTHDRLWRVEHTLLVFYFVWSSGQIVVNSRHAFLIELTGLLQQLFTSPRFLRWENV